MPMSQRVAEMVQEQLESLPFKDFFTHDTVLVPVPKSGRRMAHELWVPEQIAKALNRLGIGGPISPCLLRATSIRKSAFCASDDRPTALEHFQTMAVDTRISQPERVVLVDDIVTMGATLLGGANRLIDAYPRVQVLAFAVIRTQSERFSFKWDTRPCVGTITLQGNGRTIRRP